MTVLEAIQKSTEFLAQKGVDSPRLNAELLLADVLKLPRMRLYLEFERSLAPAETDALRERVRRRARREPLQHIVGTASFCGLDIRVDPRVLVPRPETELLAEQGWLFLNRVAATNPQPLALDFGTGSGCIAIALARNCPSAAITALEASADALVVARENAERLQVSGRIEFREGRGLEVLPEGIRFELIISNPPYIPSEAIGSLPPEVRDHDPRGALDGGADGLDFFRQLAGGAGAYLAGDGRVMVEFGDGQEKAVRAVFEAQKWIVEAVCDDYTHRPRILTARRG